MHLNDLVHDVVEPRLSGLCEELEVPGAAVMVAADDAAVTTTAGVVNTRTGVAVTPAAIFQIQSITKVWTATLVMQLVDEGLVDLDERVVEYLPEFRTADASASARITVRQLLTHSGGFEGDDWRSTTTDDTALARFVTDLVPQLPQHLPPGERFSYCSAGYGVLGRLVEVKRKLPYPAALRHHLAQPLGITELAVSAGEALGHRTAIG
ncbi:MAG: serine hydrolase domain-containing protein, partial [Stackebrandtia sp.]